MSMTKGHMFIKTSYWMSRAGGKAGERIQTMAILAFENDGSRG